MPTRQTGSEVEIAGQTKSRRRDRVDEGMSRRLEQSERLLFFDEIPGWQKDNEYLRSGYR
jgi:hypothetical protein